MDDFILFSDTSASLKCALARIEEFLADKLALQIKPKSLQINRCDRGIPFLGHRVFPGMTRLRQENLGRCIKGMASNE